MYPEREGGLGIAPAVGVALLTLGQKLLPALLKPSELSFLPQQAKDGNIVAWWRLKAIAGTTLPVARALTTEERNALSAAVGARALDMGGHVEATNAYVVVTAFYATDGIGDNLDRSSREVLTAAAGTTAEEAVPSSAGLGLLAGLGILGALLVTTTAPARRRRS